MKRAVLLTSSLFLLLSTTAAFGQAKDNTDEAAEKTDQAALYADFEKTLTASTMVGHFMVDGDEAEQRKQERYDISRVAKLERGDYWMFNARIKYGDHDVTVPIPVEVKWAGSTPVITVDNVTIPALGTFDAACRDLGQQVRRNLAAWQSRRADVRANRKAADRRQRRGRVVEGNR